MFVFSSEDVAALLSMEAAIEAVEQAMQAVSDDKANLPLRMIVDVGENNKLGVMPGAVPGDNLFGAKLLSLYPGNPAKGLSSHIGAMLLFDPDTGAPSAMMNADALTAIRTAAASASATRALARPEAKVLALVGTGEQAESHLEALRLVRPLTQVRVAGSRLERAEAFVSRQQDRHPDLEFIACQDVQQAVSEADIVCTVTSSATPVLNGDWLSQGCHVNAVGASIPVLQEIDRQTLLRATLFVDYRASALAQAKEIIDALSDGKITEAYIKGEIGEVTAGKVPGRSSAEEITLYRSLGVAAQDLICARLVAAAGLAQGRGTRAQIL
ncbi:ornithine cyclodeaminase family protein [Rhodovibrionaceae bacterium A322]